MIRIFALMIFSLAAGSSGHAASDPLDQERIRSLYNDGDFDGVLDMIGRFRSRNPACSRSDSIFIAKHLAVVYAANPKSVGQGKFWMNELLKLMPAADLVGMYVSEEIDRIFEKVREEYLSRQRSFGVDTAGLVLPARPMPGVGDGGNPARTEATAPENRNAREPGAPQEPITSRSAAAEPAADDGAARRKSGRRAYWILGGTAVAAAAGVTAYYLMTSAETSDPPEYVIPKGSAP